MHENLHQHCKSDQEFKQRLKHLDQRGSIELIMGTMFAGKSTELLRRINMHEIAGKKVMRLKFSADERYNNSCAISTHSGLRKDAIPVTTLSEIGDAWRKFDVIGIDEGQFFSDLVHFAEAAANAQKIVIISSLQGTFHRGPWQNIIELIPLCEKVKKISAICKLCKVPASFTFRTADKSCKKTIGGADMYMPLCRDCHARETRLNQKNHFEGDPELVDLKAESEAKLTKQLKISQESSEDPKSFSTDLDSSLSLEIQTE
jgi:thymidine kinase